MLSHAYTKRRLMKELAYKVGIRQELSEKILSTLAEIAYREAAIEGFIIPGICKLEIVERKARKIRNPRTGETFVIPPHRALKATVSSIAKQVVAPRPKAVPLAEYVPPKEPFGPQIAPKPIAAAPRPVLQKPAIAAAKPSPIIHKPVVGATPAPTPAPIAPAVASTAAPVSPVTPTIHKPVIGGATSIPTIHKPVIGSTTSHIVPAPIVPPPVVEAPKPEPVPEPVAETPAPTPTPEPVEEVKMEPVEEPVAEIKPEPIAEEPKVEEPKAEEPKAEEPKAEEPAPAPVAEEKPAEPVLEPVEEVKMEPVEEPVAEIKPEPKAEEPKVEEPKAEEPTPAPVAEEKPAEPVLEPVEEAKAEPAEEPVAEIKPEPVAEEPKVEEPVAEEPKVEEPAPEPAPVAEEAPAPEEPEQPAEVAETEQSDEAAPEAEAPQEVAEEAPQESGVPESIYFRCPQCNQEIEAPGNAVGAEAECPLCGAIVIIPQYNEDGTVEKSEVVSAQEAEKMEPEVLKHRTIRIDAAELGLEDLQNSDLQSQMITFVCDACQQEIEATIDMAGTQAECPNCGAAIMVPMFSPGASSEDDEMTPEMKNRTMRIDINNF